LSAVDFRLFALPLNQDHVLRRQAFGREGFSMVVDVETPHEVLSGMWQMLGDQDNVPYYACMDMLPYWIDKLGWAYVPLEYEYTDALFVASRRDVACPEAARRALQCDGESMMTLVEDGAGDHRMTELR
jgi:hypothetical protein